MPVMLLNKFRHGSSWMRGLSIVPNVFENALDLLVASSVINVLSLAIPLTLMQVYDRIIPHSALSTLSWLVIGCTIAVAMDGSLRFFRAQISNWMAARFEHFLGCSVVERILACRLSEFEQDGLGVYLDRVNSISTLRSIYAGQIFQVLLDIPFAALFIGAIWYLAGDLAYFPLAVIGIYFLFIFFIKTFYYYIVLAIFKFFVTVWKYLQRYSYWSYLIFFINVKFCSFAYFFFIFFYPCRDR